MMQKYEEQIEREYEKIKKSRQKIAILKKKIKEEKKRKASQIGKAMFSVWPEILDKMHEEDFDLDGYVGSREFVIDFFEATGNKDMLMRIEERDGFDVDDDLMQRAAEGYFVRDAKQNVVYCPGEHILKKKSVTKRGKTRYAHKAACQVCPYFSKCHTGKQGFRVVEFVDSTFEKPCGWVMPEE